MCLLVCSFHLYLSLSFYIRMPQLWAPLWLQGVFPSDKVRGVRKCIDYQPLTNHLRQARSALTAMTFLPAVTVICQHRLTPGIFRAQRWEIIRPDRPLGLNQGHESTPATSFQSSVVGVGGQNQPMIRSCPWYRRLGGKITNERSGYQREEWYIVIIMNPHLSHTGIFHHPADIRVKRQRGEHACNYFTDKPVTVICSGGDNCAWTDRHMVYLPMLPTLQ